MGEVIMGEEGTPISMTNNNSKEKHSNSYSDEGLIDVTDSDFEELIDESDTDVEQAVDIASSLGFSDDSVKIYLQQIGKIPLLSHEEELEIAKKMWISVKEWMEKGDYIINIRTI